MLLKAEQDAAQAMLRAAHARQVVLRVAAEQRAFFAWLLASKRLAADPQAPPPVPLDEPAVLRFLQGQFVVDLLLPELAVSLSFPITTLRY